MKTWKLTVTEEELKALISYHRFNDPNSYTVDTSARIHDLTKRLNKDTPEIEKDEPQTTETAPPAPVTQGWG